MRARYLIIGTLALLLVAGCGTRDAAVPAAGPETVRVQHVADGDTFTLTDGRTVRVLGIDSCEGGTGPGRAATADAVALIGGTTVTLRPEPGVDLDRYGRVLRYVAVPDGRDLATVMVARPHTGVYEGGDAAASYVAALRAADDGPRDCAEAPPSTTAAPQPVRPATQAANPPPSSAAPTTRAAAPKPAAPKPVAPKPAAPKPAAPQQPAGSGCHPSYVPCVPAGPDLDCPDIGHPVRVVGPDSFRLDADKDGVGCE